MKEKKILIGFACLFFAVMAVFTGISRHIAQSALTPVETVQQFGQVEIPKERLFFDREGEPFVQVVTAQPSILGEQYVVDRVRVKVVKEGEDTVVLNPGDFAYEIIVDAEMPLADGEKVRKE